MEKIATRQSFGKALLELGAKYPNIVCFDADLSKSTMSALFAKEYPTRFFEMGIQEANMIGAAAGMSFMGKIPFICSFGAFLTGRFDQIRMSIGYSRANVKLIGTHAGVTIGEDGHSQMGLEDVALMRSIPEMVVLQPGDDKECREMIEWSILHKGPVYLRLTRQNIRKFDMEKFELGKFQQLVKGEKIAMIGCGGLLEETFNASEIIKTKSNSKIKPSVYNMGTTKPLDPKFMQDLSKKYDTFIVLEDHTIMGGSGSAICEWMSEEAQTPKRVYRYGVRDVFGESGSPEEMIKRHKFTKEQIADFVLEFL